jgi:hypothetical protein
MVIVVVLLVYSISDPKHMFTSLLPRAVNLRFLPIENNIARAHFLVEVKKIAINHGCCSSSSRYREQRSDTTAKAAAN